MIDQALRWVRGALDAAPWSTFSLLVVVIAAAVLAYPVGRLLRSWPLVVGLLVVAVGTVAVFTLSPSASGGLAEGCSMTLHRPHRSDLLEPTQLSLNIWLFVPLGILVTWLRPWVLVAAGVFGCLALPWAIEAVQYAVPELHRVCDLVDVLMNQLGALIGIAIGLTIRATVWLFTAAADRFR